MIAKNITRLSVTLGVATVIVIYMILLAPIYLCYSYPSRDAFAKIDLVSELKYFIMKFNRPLIFNFFTYQSVTPFISEAIMTFIALVLHKVLIAYIIVIILWGIVGFLGMHTLINKLTRNPMLSALVGIIYVFNVYFVNELLRGHISIIAGYAILPWIYVLLRELIVTELVQHNSIGKNSSRLNLSKLLLFALFLALSIASHAYMAVITIIEITIFIAIYFMYLLIRYKNLSIVIHIFAQLVYKLALVFAIALALSLWYVVPLLITGKFTAIKRGILVSASIEYKLRYSENFIDALALLPIYLGDLIKGGTLIQTPISHYIMATLIQIVLISFVLLSLRKVKSKFDAIVLSSIFIFALTLSLGPRTLTGSIIANKLMSSVREFYHFISLAVFAELSLLALAIQSHIELNEFVRSFKSIIRSINYRVVSTVPLMLILLESVLFILTVNQSTVFITTNYFNDIKTEFEIISNRCELLSNNSKFAISLPGGWSNVYYVVVQNGTKSVVNGLFMAAGILTNKPLMVLNIKSPFILSEPIYGRGSLLYNMLYGGFASSSLPDLLCYLNTKYIILNEYDVFTKSVINRIKYRLETYNYFRKVYYSNNSQLFSLANCNCASYRLASNIVFFIGSLSSLTEYIHFVNERNKLCDTAIIYYSQIITNKNYNITQILDNSDTIVFASGANYLDLVYLIYRQVMFKYIKSINLIGNVKIITSNELNDYLERQLYKYVLTPAYIIHNGSGIKIQVRKSTHQESKQYILAFKVYVKPENAKLEIVVDNKLIKVINLGLYPGFGFRWVLLRLNLSFNSLYMISYGKGNVIVDSIILMPKEDYVKKVNCIGDLLAKKTVIYLISPNSYPIIGRNIHVERDPNSIDDFALLVPWHKSHSALFYINGIYIPKNHHIKLALRIRSHQKYLGANKYNCLISLISKNGTKKVPCSINLVNNYTNEYIDLGIVRKGHNDTIIFQSLSNNMQIIVDYIMLILTPLEIHDHNNGNMLHKYEIIVEISKEIFSDKILKIIINLRTNINSALPVSKYRALLLPILYNKYVFLRINNKEVHPVPSLGLTLFILPMDDNNSIVSYLCLKYQRYYILSCVLSLTALIVIIAYLALNLALNTFECTSKFSRLVLLSITRK